MKPGKVSINIVRLRAADSITDYQFTVYASATWNNTRPNATNYDFLHNVSETQGLAFNPEYHPSLQACQSRGDCYLFLAVACSLNVNYSLLLTNRCGPADAPLG